MRRRIPGLLAVAAMSALGHAQASKTLDSGTLTITSKSPYGTQTTTEEFTIVQNADGGFTMTTVSSGGRRMRSVLTTDSAGTPMAYEHHGIGGESVEKSITSRRDDAGALVISEASTRNPPRAPFRLPADTLVFGDGGFAQAWFLALGPVPRDVGYFEAGAWSLQKARLSDAAPESVTIEGTEIAATHLVLSGGLVRRDVWLDSRGGLLKVSLQNSNSVALRTRRPQPQPAG